MRIGRRGFTLIELITAMAIMVVLMSAIASSILFSSRTISGTGAANQTSLLSAADSSDQITDDLNVAMNFSERTGSSVAFTVPDRVSNGTPNQVRYAWDGVVGHSLTRQFCPSATPTLTSSSTTYPPVSLPGSVSNFGLNYLFRQMGTAALSDSTISSNNTMLILNFSNSNQTYNIDAKDWVSQYFVPTVPVGSTSYSITRIQVQMASSGTSDGTMFLEVVRPDVLLRPLGTVLEKEPFYECQLSSAAEYCTVKFSHLTGLSPTAGLCLVVGYTSGTGVGAVTQYQSSLLLIAAAGYSTTANAGSTWSIPVANKLMYFTVYGTVP